MSDLPLVLIGGWGVPVTAVFPLAAHWPGPVISYSLDDRQLQPGCTPDDLLRGWLGALEGPALWAGWSLGGQLAVRAAELAPQKVAGVFTCCSNPCFLARDGWSPGMGVDEFEAFRVGISRQTSRFWKRFLLLQIRGDRDEAEGRLALGPWLAGGAPYSRETLLTGLSWLAALDQRQAWAELDLPRRHVFGQADELVDKRVARELEQLRIPVEVIPGMAHWPFGAHAENLARQLAGFGEQVAQKEGRT